MILLDKLPDDSEFKRVADRNGRWSEEKRMLAEIVNEQYRLRASFMAANTVDGDGWFDPSQFYFRDPVIAVAVAEAEATKAQAEQSSQDTFDAELGL